jgi:hypothetical protein
MDGESWMVDGETSVMMMAMISSKSPSRRVPEQSFWFQITDSDGGNAAELYLGKTPNPRYFQVRGYM